MIDCPQCTHYLMITLLPLSISVVCVSLVVSLFNVSELQYHTVTDVYRATLKDLASVFAITCTSQGKKKILINLSAVPVDHGLVSAVVVVQTVRGTETLCAPPVVMTVRVKWRTSVRQLVCWDLNVRVSEVYLLVEDGFFFNEKLYRDETTYHTYI